MSTIRTRILKRGLVASTLYRRLVELGQDPKKVESIGLLDFLEPVNLQWERFGDGLTDFFLAREADFDRPDGAESTFLKDVVALATRIDALYRKPAPETTVDVLGRLMRFEGWHAQPNQLENWRKAAMKVAKGNEGPQVRAARYRELFRQMWVYQPQNIEAEITVFEEEVTWANAHRARLAQFGYDRN